jgi:Ca-activated chloride channel homolog
MSPRAMGSAPFLKTLASALFAVLLSAATGIAKSPDDFLHRAAGKYVQGRLQEASVDVEEGLHLFPNDSRLKALAAQLKKMKDQQKKDQGGQDQQGGDQNKDKDKKDQKDSSGQGQQDGKQDQKDKDQEKEKEKEKEKEGQDKEKDKPKDGQEQPKPEEGKQGDSSGQAASPAKPGQMSKEEAERLLNSYQDDEKKEQKNKQRRGRPVEVEEDW